MRTWVLAALSLLGTGCGGPVLRNAPRVNSTAVAAGAAAIAGAATIADPDAAARRQERKRDSDVARPPQEVDTYVPGDVLDRLDEAEREAAEQEYRGQD